MCVVVYLLTIRIARQKACWCNNQSKVIKINSIVIVNKSILVKEAKVGKLGHRFDVQNTRYLQSDFFTID